MGKVIDINFGKKCSKCSNKGRIKICSTCYNKDKFIKEK